MVRQPLGRRAAELGASSKLPIIIFMLCLQTMQCAAFLAGMVRSRLIRRAMVLAPKTLLGQWAAELRRCGLAGRVFEYHGTSASERCSIMSNTPSFEKPAKHNVMAMPTSASERFTFV